MINIIGLSLSILQGFLKQNSLPADIVADIQIAIEALTRVHDSPVMKEQLESARFTPEW